MAKINDDAYFISCYQHFKDRGFDYTRHVQPRSVTFLRYFCMTGYVTEAKLNAILSPDPTNTKQQAPQISIDEQNMLHDAILHNPVASEV